MKSLKEILLSSKRPSNVVEQLTGEIKQEKVAKGAILQLSGSERHFSFFVRKGLLRSYYIDEKGKELARCFS